MPRVLGFDASGQSGDFTLTRQSGQPPRRQKKFRRTILVLADDADQVEEDILATTGVPPELSTISGAPCIARSAEIAEVTRHPLLGVPTNLWRVLCDFDDSRDTEDADKPPESRRPKVRWGGELEQTRLWKDAITGDAVITVPGEQMYVETNEGIVILTIQRYELWPYDPDISLRYVNKTNKTPFWGAPRGTAWMQPIQTEEEVIEGVVYINVTYTIKFKMEEILDQNGVFTGFKEFTWKAHLLHHGSRYYTPEQINNFKANNPGAGQIPTRAEANLLRRGYNPTAWLDAKKNVGTVNLDEWGRELKHSEYIADREVFLDFNRYQEVDFNALNLGPF